MFPNAHTIWHCIGDTAGAFVTLVGALLICVFYSLITVVWMKFDDRTYARLLQAIFVFCALSGYGPILMSCSGATVGVAYWLRAYVMQPVLVIACIWFLINSTRTIHIDVIEDASLAEHLRAARAKVEQMAMGHRKDVDAAQGRADIAQGKADAAQAKADTAAQDAVDSSLLTNTLLEHLSDTIGMLDRWAETESSKDKDKQ